MLDIVNEKDEVIGQDTRENIHKNGLIHREMGIWVFNDKGEVILQKRSMTKKHHPGCWSDSAAGHVESGDSYLVTAIRELKEETGIDAKENELIEIDKVLVGKDDFLKDGLNNHFEIIYAYKFKEGIDKLKIENGEAEELRWWNIDELLNADENLKKQFVPYIFSFMIIATLKKVKELSLDLNKQ